jgi:hypothetical protein
MKKAICRLALLAACFGWSSRTLAGDEKNRFPSFQMQEIETGLSVGYAVIFADVNHDGKPDIVVVDTSRVLWYENPTWKRHTIIEGQTRPDNVCIAAGDLEGKGRVDFALGADWRGANPKAEGTLQWLQPGSAADQSYTVHPLGAEPTVHRLRFVDLYGDGRPRLVVAPLVGRHATARNNWMDGPVRLLAYEVPGNPAGDRWTPEILDESLHVIHNFWPVPAASGKGRDLLIASYEGVSLLSRDGSGKWRRRLLGAGNQEKPRNNRGASEVKLGHWPSGREFIATIEPWHGHQVVVYTPPAGKAYRKPLAPEAGERGQSGLWDRHVLDEKLKWGHAVWCADLDGDGGDELIIGVRDDLSMNPGERRGVRVYKAMDDGGARWQRQILDDGGVAVEDLAAVDLDGDGRIDLVAVGRQTHNIRIYWNKGKAKDR